MQHAAVTLSKSQPAQARVWKDPIGQAKLPLLNQVSNCLQTYRPYASKSNAIHLKKAGL
jgi:hypothetical protein